MAAALRDKLGKIHGTATADPGATARRVLATVREMLHDRGCDEIESCITLDEIEERIAENSPVATATGSGGSRTEVFFCAEEKVGVKHLRAWLDGGAADVDTVVACSLDGPTSFTRKEAEASAACVQWFKFRELTVNVTRHSLVPAHRRIKGVPTAAGMPITLSALPLLSTQDQVCRYYGFAVGDVVEITRTCGTQEPVKYYRQVVHQVQ
jgi:DNA-directed RNA polymerase subunit H (RpoH/RPB5)